MKTMVKRTFLVMLFAFMGVVLYAHEEPVTLTTPTGDIKGTLLLPENVEFPVKIALLHAGSGPTDRDGNQPNMKSNSLKFLAEELAANGIASVRYDKRGIGESNPAGVSELDLRFEMYVDDMKQWIELLHNDKRFSKIITVGHSEGALIAMAASARNSKVKSYVSIAGSGRPADDLLKDQLITQPREVVDMVFPMIDSLKSGSTLSNVPEAFNALFRPSVQPYLISWFAYNPRDLIKKVRCPILLLQGNKDIQVAVLDANLLAGAKPDAKRVIIPDMNHVLKDCKTDNKAEQLPMYSNPELPINKTLVTELVDFVKAA